MAELNMADRVASRANAGGESADAHATTAECRVFARFLAGSAPSAYVTASYARLLPTTAALPTHDARLIERALMAFARQGALATRVADSYARFFMPRSLLRRRLMLLLAILENSPSSERPLNSAIEASLPGVVVRLGVIGIGSGLCLLLGVVLFAPLQLMSGSADPAPVRGH